MLAKKLFTSILSSVVLISGSVFAETVESSFTTDDNQTISYIKAEHEGLDALKAKGAIVISQGYTEHYAKYDTLIQELHEDGYNVYALDHRGQGLSGRDGLGVLDLNTFQVKNVDGQTLHINSWGDYVADLDEFVNKVVLQKRQKQMIILGHSMGSAIANSYLIEHKEVFDKAILLSPMYEPVIPDGAPFSDPESVLQASVAFCHPDLAQYGNGVFCAASPLDVSADMTMPYIISGEGTPGSEVAFQMNGGTLDYESWATYQAYRLQSVAAGESVITTRPSFGWLKEAIIEGRTLQARAAEVETPVLMMGATMDFFVNASLQAPTCDAMQDCTFVGTAEADAILAGAGMPPSFHELYRERAPIKDLVMSEITEFLKVDKAYLKKLLKKRVRNLIEKVQN